MRRRIRTHKGLTGPLQVAGHDLKLGPGGIRGSVLHPDPPAHHRRARPALRAAARCRPPAT